MINFNNNIYNLERNVKPSFLPQDIEKINVKSLFFVEKQNELIQKYETARRFLYETDTDDWKHYLGEQTFSEKDEKYFKYIHKAQWYEAALFFYNTVVDLSWIICYVGSEYVFYRNEKPIIFENIVSIDEACKVLRKIEVSMKKPENNNESPFVYLTKMKSEGFKAIDIITEFWNEFYKTPIRKNYNYLKHGGAFAYEEILECNDYASVLWIINDKKCPTSVKNIQRKANLEQEIKNLAKFDDEVLYPYLEKLFNEFKRILDISLAI